MKKFLIIVGIMLIASCKTIYVPVPAETSTTVTVKDSTIWNIKDSVRVIERSRYKDYGNLLDTLKIDGNHSHMRSWIDTTKNILNGELVEDPVKEKTRIEYRDRIEYKDSVRIEEKPVPYEVEKPVKYTPWYWKTLGWIGILSLLAVLGYAGLKIMKLRGTGFLSIFKIK